jgi:hypothetical protein
VALCCQTDEIAEYDCIYDLARSCFRPATGIDTAEVSGCPTAELETQLEAAGHDPALARCDTSWSVSAHATHQDPGPSGPDSACSTLSAAGVLDFWTCISLLTVADQRGFCLSKSADVQACPGELLEYQDACERLNEDLGMICG